MNCHSSGEERKDKMVLTQLEATVSEDQWETLKQAYREEINEPLPDYLLQTYLVQDENQRDLWRILTVWKSRQALLDYRASVETPSGVLMFRAAGAEPKLTIFTVAEVARKG
jgi:quinol monooxygenase YgiN